MVRVIKTIAPLFNTKVVSQFTERHCIQLCAICTPALNEEYSLISLFRQTSLALWWFGYWNKLWYITALWSSSSVLVSTMVHLWCLPVACRNLPTATGPRRRKYSWLPTLWPSQESSITWVHSCSMVYSVHLFYNVHNCLNMKCTIFTHGTTDDKTLGQQWLFWESPCKLLFCYSDTLVSHLLSYFLLPPSYPLLPLPSLFPSSSVSLFPSSSFLTCRQVSGWWGRFWTRRTQEPEQKFLHSSLK